MSSKAKELFEAVCSLNMSKVSLAPHKWYRSFDDLVTFDPKFDLWSIDVDWMSQEAREKFVRNLNARWRYTANESERDYLKLSTDIETGRVTAIIDLLTLQHLATQLKANGKNSNAGHLFRSYYSDYIEQAASRLLKQTLNLDVGRRENHEDRLFLHTTPYVDDEGKESTDVFLYIGKQVGRSVYLSDLLYQSIEDTFHRVAGFLVGSSLLDENQIQAIKTIFGEDGKSSPLTKIMYENEEYDLVIDLAEVKTLADAGISIDLFPIIDQHLTYISKDHHLWGWDAQNTAAQAWQIATGLSSYAHIDRNVLSYSGKSSHGSLFYRSRTGQCFKSIGDELPVDDKKAEYSINVAFSMLEKQDADRLSAELIALWHSELKRAGIEGDFPVIIGERTFPSIDYKLVFPYEPIETLLRQNKAIDLSPVLEKYFPLQAAYMERGRVVKDHILASLRHTGIKFPIDFPANFLGADYEDIRKNIPEECSLSCKRNFQTSAIDFPDPKDQYDDITRRANEALIQIGLDQDIQIESGSCRYAGGVTGHSMHWKMPLLSLQQSEALASKLEKEKDILRPYIEEMIGSSAMSFIIHDILPEYDRSESSERKKRLQYTYAATEIAKLGGADLQMTLLAFEPTVSEFINYLVACRYDTNSTIREIAEKELTEIAALSPAFASLITKAESALPSPEAFPELSGSLKTLQAPTPNQ